MVIFGGLELVAAGLIYKEMEKDKRKQRTKDELQDWERRQRRAQRREDRDQRRNSNSRPHPMQQNSLYPTQPMPGGYPPRASSAPPAAMMPPQRSSHSSKHPQQPQWQQPQQQRPAPPNGWQGQNSYPGTSQPPQYQAPQIQYPPQPQPQAHQGYPPQQFNRDPDAKNPNLYYPPQAQSTPNVHITPPTPAPRVSSPRPGVMELSAEPVHHSARPQQAPYNAHLNSLRYGSAPSVISSAGGSEAMGERPDASTASIHRVSDILKSCPKGCRMDEIWVRTLLVHLEFRRSRCYEMM